MRVKLIAAQKDTTSLHLRPKPRVKRFLSYMGISAQRQYIHTERQEKLKSNFPRLYSRATLKHMRKLQEHSCYHMQTPRRSPFSHPGTPTKSTSPFANHKVGCLPTCCAHAQLCNRCPYSAIQPFNHSSPVNLSFRHPEWDFEGERPEAGSI